MKTIMRSLIRGNCRSRIDEARRPGISCGRLNGPFRFETAGPWPFQITISVRSILRRDAISRISLSGAYDIPAYQLAVVVDDAAMHISEVVRGPICCAAQPADYVD